MHAQRCHPAIQRLTLYLLLDDFSPTQTHTRTHLSHRTPFIPPFAAHTHKNFTTTTSYATQQPDLPIILITPPPLDANAWKNFKRLPESNRTNQRHRTYGLALYQVSEFHAPHCSVYNTWHSLEGTAGQTVYSQYLTDGLHLNESGNRQLYRGLMETIRLQHPTLRPNYVPMEGPSWEDLC